MLRVDSLNPAVPHGNPFDAESKEIKEEEEEEEEEEDQTGDYQLDKILQRSQRLQPIDVLVVVVGSHHQLSIVAGSYYLHLQLHHVEEMREEDDEKEGDGIVLSEVRGDLCLSDVPGMVADVDNHHRLLPTAHDLRPPA